MKKLMSLVLLASCVLLLKAGELQSPERAPKLFPLTDVRITDGQMRLIQDLSHRYLLSLEPDRLLSWFRREAGLTPKAQPYPLWESEDFQSTGPLPGHIMGFYLSGMSMMYQSTGDPAIIERLRYAVHGLREAQDAGGDGYLAATRIGRHTFEDVVSRQFVTTNPMINDTWEPVYVMNKLMLGLYDAYTLCGIDEAKSVLIKMADWFGVNVIDKIDHDTMQRLLVCEHGSINESFVDVYNLTGDAKYLHWAERLNDEAMWVPLSEGRDILEGWHANTQIPKFTGFVSVGLADGDRRMTDAAKLFWNIVVKNHTWVNGGNSSGEHFFNEGEYIYKVTSIGGPESCNSVNMMRLTEALYQVDGDIRRVDYYERVLMNHILGNFNPGTGMSCYFTSMRPGHYKVYADPYKSFWCCVGTGLQAPAKLAKMVYAHDGDTLFVNMFVPTTLKWQERNISIEQATSYPDDDKSVLTVHGHGQFKIAVRCPYWVEKGSMQVRVNGKRHALSLSDGDRSQYVVINRTWRDGDKISVTFRPRLYVEPLKKFDQYLSIQYGAMVMASKIDNHGLTHDDFVQARDHTARIAIPASDVTTLVGTIASIRKGISREKSDTLVLKMKVAGAKNPITLIPFSRIAFDRYEVYFPHVVASKDLGAGRVDSLPSSEQPGRFAESQVDSIEVGDSVSERQHRMESYRSYTGLSHGQKWREAYNGGFFMYQMACSPDKSMKLAIRYLRSDSGNRVFDIQIDGRTVQTVRHRRPKEGDIEKPFYYEETAIPDSLTHGKRQVTVKFNAHNHCQAGHVCDIRLLQADNNQNN